MSEEILLSLEQRQQMLQHITSCMPEEACGLIGGVVNRTVVIFPIENELHSPLRFRMKPEQQLQAFLTMEQMGLDLIGIYHSHPNGPEFPSETDLSEFAYPGTAYLICSRLETDWKVRSFQMMDQEFTEIPIKVL